MNEGRGALSEQCRHESALCLPSNPLTPLGRATAGSGLPSLSVRPKRTYAQTTKSPSDDNRQGEIVSMYYQMQTRLCHEQGWPIAYVHVNGKPITALLDSSAKVN